MCLMGSDARVNVSDRPGSIRAAARRWGGFAAVIHKRANGEWRGQAATSDQCGRSQHGLDSMVNVFLMKAGMVRE